MNVSFVGQYKEYQKIVYKWLYEIAYDYSKKDICFVCYSPFTEYVSYYDIAESALKTNRKDIVYLFLYTTDDQLKNIKQIMLNLKSLLHEHDVMHAVHIDKLLEVKI